MSTPHSMPDSATDLSAYVRSISSLGRISAQEERDLSTAWRERRDTAARDRLITTNVRLVIAYAKRYSGRGIPLDELVAEGNVGLIEAVDNFDPGVGCRFSTYAAFWIRKSIGECFARGTSRPKASRHDRAVLAELDHTLSDFAARLGRTPDSTELAAALGRSIDQVQTLETLRAARASHHSLSDLRADSVADDRQTQPTHELAMTERHEMKSSLVQQLLGVLSDAEHRTVSLRFGIDGGSPRSVTSVASILNEPPRRTKATLKMALAKLARTGQARALAASWAAA